MKINKIKKIYIPILLSVLIGSNTCGLTYFNADKNIDINIETLSETNDNSNIDNDKWDTNVSNMIYEKTGLNAVVYNNKIYCIGGKSNYTSPSVQIYDIEQNVWSQGADMITPRQNFSISLIKGKIYCIGGSQSVNRMKSVEVYDIETNTWEAKTDMPKARKYLASGVVGDNIYVIGGDDGSYSNVVEIYNTKTDSWTTGRSMPTERQGHSIATIGDDLYVIGGQGSGNGAIRTVEIYNTTSDSWRTSSSMPTARYGLTTSVIGDDIYCIGGRDFSNPKLTVNEVYNIKTKEWTTKASMPTARYDLTSVVHNNKIYCIGGYNYSQYFKVVEVFIPNGNTPQYIAEQEVIKAEGSKSIVDIENAREEVNKLSEGEIKQALQDRINAIAPNVTFNLVSSTANLDIYIESDSSITMTLDTNSINFKGYSAVEDIIKENAVTLTIKSSLPYELNSYLVQEITNLDDNSIILDKEVLNVRANGEEEFNTFDDIGTTPVLLLDNQKQGEINTHGIDFMLDADIPYADGNYKTVVKFEAKQK